ncbi:unnamed protein product [Rhizophagus irregularis]|nr:unnamed protein product [Rhizophagus irregularis]
MNSYPSEQSVLFHIQVQALQHFGSSVFSSSVLSSIDPSSLALIFWLQGSKIPALWHFGSLFYCSNSSFLLGPGSLAISVL